MKKLLSFMTIAVVFLTAVQGFIPSMPVSDPNTAKYASGIIVFLILAATAWKQFASSEISNASLIPTLCVALVATLGGFLDLFNKLPFNEHTAQCVRFGISAITAFLNLVSSSAFPTYLSSCLIAAMIFLGLSGCTITKQQSVLRGACEVHEFNSFNKQVDTTSGLPPQLAGVDSAGVYYVCNTQQLIHAYPELGKDIAAAKTTFASWILKLMKKL